MTAGRTVNAASHHWGTPHIYAEAVQQLGSNTDIRAVADKFYDKLFTETAGFTKFEASYIADNAFLFQYQLLLLLWVMILWFAHLV